MGRIHLIDFVIAWCGIRDVIFIVVKSASCSARLSRDFSALARALQHPRCVCTGKNGADAATS
jgi:hypothetical protein